MYQDSLRVLKQTWADRSIQDLEREREGLDFFKDREQYMALEEARQQLLQFRKMQRSNTVIGE